MVAVGALLGHAEFEVIRHIVTDALFRTCHRRTQDVLAGAVEGAPDVVTPHFGASEGRACLGAARIDAARPHNFDKGRRSIVEREHTAEGQRGV